MCVCDGYRFCLYFYDIPLGFLDYSEHVTLFLFFILLFVNIYPFSFSLELNDEQHI